VTGLLILFLTTACAVGEDLVPLAIELPKPLFVGTPRLVISPNLEEVTRERRPPFQAPRGTVNVALRRPVTASDRNPFFGKLEMVTDGDKEGDGNSFVELDLGQQWVQVDLGAVYRIEAVVVWHYHGEPRVYHDVVVQVADDPDFVDSPTTLFNNDHDNSSGLGRGRDKEYIETYEGRLIPGKRTEARYVRLYSRGNTSDDTNAYIEVEVYALPEP
jgi:hypothetical protein